MNKTWIYVIVAVAVIVGFIAFKTVKAVPVDNQDSPFDPLPDPGTKSALMPGSFPIRKGDRTELVKQLQQILNSKYGQKIIADGIWGPGTQKAVDAAMSKLLGKTVSGTEVISQANFNDLSGGKSYEPITWRNNQWVNSVIDDVNDLFTKGDKTKAHQIVSIGRYDDGQLKLIYDNYKDKFYSSFTRALSSFQSNDPTVMAAQRTILKNLNRLKLA